MKLFFRTLLIVFGLALGLFSGSLRTDQVQAQGGLEIITNYNNNSPCSNGSCPVEAGQYAFNFVCDGRVQDCRQGEAEGASVQTTACGKSVQVDVFNTNCRPNGVGQEPWACGDPSTIVTYMTWYTGDCGPGGSSGPSCKNIAGLTGDTANPTAASAAKTPRIGETMFLRCRKVPNASDYKFRIFYSRKNRPGVYENLANLDPVGLKQFEDTNRSINFEVTQVGFYYGQCRVCLPDASAASGQRCGAWESTANPGERWTDDEGNANSGFSDQSGADDNLPNAALPRTRSNGEALIQDAESSNEVGEAGQTVQLSFPEED